VSFVVLTWNLLLCKMLFIVLCSSVLASLFKLYVCRRLYRKRIAACLCSDGWQESLGIIVSVNVGLRKIWKLKFEFVLCIEISKKLRQLLDSICVLRYFLSSSIHFLLFFSLFSLLYLILLCLSSNHPPRCFCFYVTNDKLSVLYSTHSEEIRRGKSWL
jgi:hypothetical protein